MLVVVVVCSSTHVMEEDEMDDDGAAADSDGDWVDREEGAVAGADDVVGGCVGARWYYYSYYCDGPVQPHPVQVPHRREDEEEVVPGQEDSASSTSVHVDGDNLGSDPLADVDRGDHVDSDVDARTVIDDDNTAAGSDEYFDIHRG
jgi:hypothetical protein